MLAKVKMTFLADSCATTSFRLIIRKTKFLCNSAANIHMAISEDAKSTMELTSVPPIVATYRQAFETFDAKNKHQLENNMNKLKIMMDKLTADDLGYNRALDDELPWRRRGKAPCTYIEVLQNQLLNMSIFVLAPDFIMPMHDHPQMHGMLKVISGTVNIRSFSEAPFQEAVKEMGFVKRAMYEANPITQDIHGRRRFFAKVDTNTICTESSETCILTPAISNYHEIQALDGPAAFFDILSPPYGTYSDQIGSRKCNYYEVSNEISTNLVELQQTSIPDFFYCDQYPYLGPALE